MSPSLHASFSFSFPVWLQRFFAVFGIFATGIWIHQLGVPDFLFFE